MEPHTAPQFTFEVFQYQQGADSLYFEDVVEPGLFLNLPARPGANFCATCTVNEETAVLIMWTKGMANLIPMARIMNSPCFA